MARRKRVSGFLHQRVLQLLEARYPYPLTGLQLAALLHAEGDAVPVSQVYRAIRRLVDEGTVRKILVAGGYVPAGPEPVMLLWCRACGRVLELPSPALFERLGKRAVEAGLTAERSVVEVPGLCAACSGSAPP